MWNWSISVLVITFYFQSKYKNIKERLKDSICINEVWDLEMFYKKMLYWLRYELVIISIYHQHESIVNIEIHQFFLSSNIQHFFYLKANIN